MEPEKIQTSLPENAYRELKPGEEYTPVMPASSNPKEVTPYSVTMGVVMAVVFSAAAAFLGLKVGQVFEAAIPIAIIAVGMGSVLGKKNMLGQNVIIQSIGASSGVIVAGAIFTLPALYILGLDAAFWQVFLSSLFGGLLGTTGDATDVDTSYSFTSTPSRGVEPIDEMLTTNPVIDTPSTIALRTTLAGIAVTELAAASAYKDFVTSDDALAERDTTLAGIDAVAPVVSDPVYGSLAELRRAVAVASGKGYFPCISLTKYLRNGISSTMPSSPPKSDERNTW